MGKLIANLVLDHMIRRFNKLTDEMDEIASVLGYRDEEGYGPLDQMNSGQFPEEEAAIAEKECANPDCALEGDQGRGRPLGTFRKDHGVL